MISPKTLIADIEATGKLKNVKIVAIDETASGSTFLMGESTQTGEMCFLKHYVTPASTAAEVEVKYTQITAQQLALLKTRYVTTIPMYDKFAVSDGSIVLVMKYVAGETLRTKAKQSPVFTPEESTIIREGLLEMAKVVATLPFAHRDICPKNIMLAGDKLVLFDFQTAMDHDTNYVFKNPSFGFVKNGLGLGAGYNPTRGEWNDICSIAKTYELIMSHLTCEKAQIQSDLETLYAAVKTVPTLRFHYVVDDAWKKANRFKYLKLRLRPSWTRKSSSKVKGLAFLNLLKQLYRAPSGTIVPPKTNQ